MRNMIKRILTLAMVTILTMAFIVSGCTKKNSLNEPVDVTEKDTTTSVENDTTSVEDETASGNEAIEDETTAAVEDGTTEAEGEVSTEDVTTSEDTTTVQEDETTKKEPVESTTTAPTTKPTVAPTKPAVTNPTTVAPTTKPTVVPTKPTIKPTVAPTQPTTVAPTVKPTVAPTKPELYVPIVKEPASLGADSIPVIEVEVPTDSQGNRWVTVLLAEVITKNIPYGYRLTQNDLKATLCVINPETYEEIPVREMKPEEFGFTAGYYTPEGKFVNTHGVCNNPRGVITVYLNATGILNVTNVKVVHEIQNETFNNYIRNNKPVYTNVKICRETIGASNIYKYGDWYFGFRGNGVETDGLTIVGYTGPDKVFTVPTEILGEKVINYTGQLEIYNESTGLYEDFSITDWDNYVEGRIIPDGIKNLI